jgi:geranylgeranyl pyrophosphate synthase
LDFINKNKGITYAENKMNEYATLAQNELNQFANIEIRESLHEFINFTIQRNK